MYDIPGLSVSQALLCHVEKYYWFLHFVKSLLTPYSLQIPMNFSWLYGLLYWLKILIWQWDFKYFQYPSDVIVNVESIYAPYHWFLSVKMLNRYTTSRTSTKYHENQLRLPNSKFIMIPIFEPFILKSHCSKRIVRKNVWKLHLETITMTTVVFCHSYILDVQIFSSNKL